jgi:signal transduction histidine kinase
MSFVRIAQVIKSASFKLGAAYVGLFSVSVGLLAALVYFSTTAEMDHEIRTRISAEAVALRAEFAHGGAAQLLQAIADRQRGRLVGGLDYTLYDAKGHRLFGDLPAIRCVPGWVTFSGPPDGDEPAGEMEQLGVQITPLPGGDCLLVGDDIGKVREFGSLILDSFSWVFLFTATLAIAGGIFLSSRVLRRIEAINRTAEAIIEGDISQRIPRRGAPDDLDRLAATLNRMLDRVTGLMESLRHVSNDVAHDLRTPLGRLRHSLAEASQTANTQEEFRQATTRALSEVDGILETFGAILRIAQIESGSRRAGFRRVSLSELVKNVCDDFTPSIEDAGKSLRTMIAPDLWVQGDPELLVQSIANLLENAIGHTPADAKIGVSLFKRGGEIEIAVADNGPGVRPEDRFRIFERFFRVENSRSTGGNGLGLSIVAAIAELHAARISACDNQPGLKVSMAFPPAA